MSPRHPLLQSLGATVRSRRQSLGWTRRELSQRTGISERFLADIEAGAANPSLLRLHDLAQVLGLELTALIGSASSGRRMIALLGLRGAGKSTVGPRLAVALGRPFVEMDARIEQATGLGLEELFQMHGEAWFRRAEREALQELMVKEPTCVLAAGGGLVTEPATFELLRSVATTAWLRARPEDHWERVLAQGDTRPMADNDRAFQDLCKILAEREPLYRMADLVVETSGRSVEAVLREVLAGLPAETAADSASR